MPSFAPPTSAPPRTTAQAGAGPTRVPSLVGAVVRSTGRPLDAEIREAMVSRVGPTAVGRARIHTDGRAAVSASVLRARAYTAGDHIVFGAGQYGSSLSSQDLLAHELAHVAAADPTPVASGHRWELGDPGAPEESRAVRFSGERPDVVPVWRERGIVRRQPGDTDAVVAATYQALTAQRFQDAVRRLGRLGVVERRAFVEALDPTTRSLLRNAALHLSPAESNPVALTLDEVERDAPGNVQAPAVRPTEASTAPASVPVSSLSAAEKLGRAWEYAKPRVAPHARQELESLFRPESLLLMALFAGVYVAAQLTPVGWLADAVALVGLALFVGTVAIPIAADIGRFFRAVFASTEDDLATAGEALARAIARGGLALFIALVTHGIRGSQGPRPPGGTPGVQLVEAQTTTGHIIRVPVPATAAVAPARSGAQTAASFAVALPPPTGSGPQPPASGGGSSGGGSGSGGGGGPERDVFSELSVELALERPGTGARGAAAAAEEASRAGFLGPRGEPAIADLGVQTHGAAPAVRAQRGQTGTSAESAHVAPTAAMRSTPGYSRSSALTTLLEPSTHAAFDAHWKAWSIAERQAGRTSCTISELYQVMLTAIENTPGLTQRVRNTLAFVLEQELFNQRGLRPTDTVPLPYPNVPAR